MSGCSDAGGEAEESDSNLPDSDVPSLDSHDTAGYQRVEPRIDLISASSAEIDALVVEAGDSIVLVRYMNAAEPCSGARVKVTESATAVEIELETGLDPNAAAMTCVAGMFGYEIAVPLADPLGSRELRGVEPVSATGADTDPLIDAVFSTDQYRGLTEAEAMEMGDIEQRVVRVARIDDEFFMLTLDFDPSRVNLEIEAGIVVAATSG